MSGVRIESERLGSLPFLKFTNKGSSAEGEDCDGWPPNGEAGRRDDRRNKPLEPLPRLGQLGGDPRAARVKLDANMVRDEPHDAFGIGGRDAAASILEAPR